MNGLQTNLTATLEGFRTDQAKLREDMALYREAAAKREIRLIFAMLAIVALGFTIFGFITA